MKTQNGWARILNARAKASMDEDSPEDEVIDTHPAITACQSVAGVLGFRKLASDDDDAREIYEAPDGVLVNLWLDGIDAENGTRLGEGGIGFDDQTDWYTD